MAWPKLGVVLPLGGVGDYDDGRLRDPAPLLLDGRILLYYSGYDSSVWRVGLAGSDDGVHFTKQGVVVPLGGAGEFDDEQASEPGPLCVDGRVLLYYAGFDGANWRVAVAGSDDGVHFTRLGVVLPLGGVGEFDEVWARGPAPLLLDGRVMLYYSGYDGSRIRVGLAASDDGVHFTKQGVVVPLGAVGEFDDTWSWTPGPLLVDGRILLWYGGYDGGVWRVGLAGSDDGVRFTKPGVVIPLGGAADFDSGRVDDPGPLMLDGRVLCYYSGYNGTTWRIGLAASDEGI